MQEHLPGGERRGVDRRARRRLAQLPPRVSMGLQDQRARRLLLQHNYRLHRRVRPDWLGLRPKVRLASDDPSQGVPIGRRQPRLGLRRRRHHQGRSGGAEDDGEARAVRTRDTHPLVARRRGRVLQTMTTENSSETSRIDHSRPLLTNWTSRSFPVILRSNRRMYRMCWKRKSREIIYIYIVMRGEGREYVCVYV